MKRSVRLLAGLGLALGSLVTMVTPAAAGRDTTPPSVPGNLQAAEVSFTWTRFTWSPSTDNSGQPPTYHFQIEGIGWNYVELDTDTGNLGGLQPGRSYRAKVQAMDRAGNNSAPVTVDFTTLPRTTPPPTAPTNLRVVFADGRPDRLEWDPSSHDGFVYYEVYADIGAVNLTTTGSTSITFAEMLQNGVIYSGLNHFTVKAWGEHQYPSGLSNLVSVTL